MNKSTNQWKQDMPVQLSEVLASIDSISDMQALLTDILTKKEITEIAARLEAARMLSNKETYISIARKTSLSSRTIARISDWLQSGAGGYKKAINLINAHHAHLSPARD